MTQRTHYRLWGATQRTTQSTAFLLVFILLDAPLGDFDFSFSTLVINLSLAPCKDPPSAILSKFSAFDSFTAAFGGLLYQHAYNINSRKLDCIVLTEESFWW